MGRVLGNAGSAVSARAALSRTVGILILHLSLTPVLQQVLSAIPPKQVSDRLLSTPVSSRGQATRLSLCVVPLQLGLPLYACSLGALPASDTSAQGSFQNRNPILRPLSLKPFRGFSLHTGQILTPQCGPAAMPKTRTASSTRLLTAPQKP